MSKTTVAPAPIGTFLPIFPGFYNTIFDESDSFIEYELSSDDFRDNYPEFDGIPDDFVKNNFWDCIDYSKANLAVVQNVVEAFAELANAYVESVTFEKVVSPREYNFKNDAVDVLIVPKIDAIAAYVKAHYEEFSAYIKATYTSYDGFMSFWSNDAEDWKEETADFTDFTANGHYLGSVLTFIVRNEGIDEETLYYASNVSEAFSENANVNTALLVAAWKEKLDAN